MTANMLEGARRYLTQAALQLGMGQIQSIVVDLCAEVVERFEEDCDFSEVPEWEVGCTALA